MEGEAGGERLNSFPTRHRSPGLLQLPLLCSRLGIGWLGCTADQARASRVCLRAVDGDALDRAMGARATGRHHAATGTVSHDRPHVRARDCHGHEGAKGSARLTVRPRHPLSAVIPRPRGDQAEFGTKANEADQDLRRGRTRPDRRPPRAPCPTRRPSPQLPGGNFAAGQRVLRFRTPRRIAALAQ